MNMVVVFHLNRCLVQYKCAALGVIVLLLLLIHTFEITYHVIHYCPQEEVIDVVYTWVNGSDPKFLTHLNWFLQKYPQNPPDILSQRYDDKDELKFSLRSLEKYAPWFNHIYIVTNGQIPCWLNMDYEKVTVITHEEIFVDRHNLPTFSSPAIEHHLHRIPGLSKRFVYFNDDIFLGAPVYRDDFYSPSRGFLIYLAWPMPLCAEECSWLYVADGNCDSPCNNPSCQMDGGDCNDPQKALPQNGLKNTNTVYTKVLSKLQNSSDSPSSHIDTITSALRNTSGNISVLITEHNRKVLAFDKLKRQKTKRRKTSDFRSKLRDINSNTDAYASSLQHTNRMLNTYYGFTLRKVPAHAPILIDTGIMENVQKRFWRFYEKSARNRIRSNDDVQFALAYYYYIIHEEIDATATEIFDEFDTDLSRLWSESEVQTVMTKLYDLPLTEKDVNHFTNFLLNCSIDLSTFIIKEHISRCPQLLSFLKSTLPIKHKYKFEVIRDAEQRHVSFKMLSSNVTEVTNQLDQIRKKARKFICLNDNLDHSRAYDNQVVRTLLSKFYTSLFPIPSKFELPPNFKNRYLYMEDYVSLGNTRQENVLYMCTVIIVLSIILFINVLRHNLCTLINRIFC